MLCVLIEGYRKEAHPSTAVRSLPCSHPKKGEWMGNPTRQFWPLAAIHQIWKVVVCLPRDQEVIFFGMGSIPTHCILFSSCWYQVGTPGLQCSSLEAVPSERRRTSCATSDAIIRTIPCDSMMMPNASGSVSLLAQTLLGTLLVGLAICSQERGQVIGAGGQPGRPKELE